jgi:hypothetical protein
MRIGITGASGRLGSRLIEKLSLQHEVITFGRSKSDCLWTLGVIPSESQLRDIDVFIHLAWSLRDRSGDYHLNVGGTLVLAQAAQAAEVPFLFISSVAAMSNSEYGKSKAQAEALVLDCMGTVVRIGLVPELNRYEVSKKRVLSLYPNFRFKIQITSFDAFRESIDRWISNDKGHFSGNIVTTIVSSEMEAREIFAQNSKLLLPIPLLVIKFVFRICKPFSLRVRNLNDALLSVTTNEGGKDGQ